MYLNDNNRIELEPDDLCMHCQFFLNWNSTDGKLCPLLNAIAWGTITLAHPDREEYMTSCDFYKEQEKRLKIVPKQDCDT